jgi:16S rRNA (cytosine1402-N4)-methyltransferase
MPICTCGKKKTIDILTRKPVTADEEELKTNPRAACAKLRAAMKLDIDQTTATSSKQ